MRRFAAVLLLTLWAGKGFGQEIKLPAEVRGEPGDFVQVKAVTGEANVRWYSPDAGLKLFPVELLRDSKTAVVTANRPGRYRLIAWTAKGDAPSGPAECVVVVGDPAPVPPVPVPPGPVPPGPDDPLAVAVRAAYARETDAGRATQLASLAALYSGAVEYAGKPEVATWGQLFALMKTAAGSMGLAGKLPLVQGAVAAELVKVLPTSAGLALDAAGRKLAADTFRRVALALEAK